jgi:CHAT domain-containing protein/tetratricopeptide (TPR) repeat protein
MKRLALGLACRLAIAIAIACAAPGVAAEDDPAALRLLAERFYTSLEARDFDAAVAAWDPSSPDLPARRAVLRRLFATYERIAVRDLRVVEVAVEGDGARVRVELDLDVREPVSDEVAAGFGPWRRVLECTRRDGTWRVRHERAVEDTLAQALLAAGDDEARLALLAADPAASRYEVVRALAGVAEGAQAQGRHEQALAAIQVAQRLAERLADPVMEARALSALGSYHLLKGEPAPSLETLQRALPLAEASGDPELEAAVLVKMGNAHTRRGEYPRAREAYQRSYALREAAGHHAANVPTLGNLGNQSALEGDYETAFTLHHRVLAEAEALEDAVVVENTLNTLGAIEHERGNYRTALTYYERSLARAEAAGRKREQAMALNNIGLAQRLQGNLDLAREHLSRSLALREGFGDKTAVAATLQNLGMVERLGGNIDGARAFYERSLALRESIGDQPGTAVTLNSLGMLQEGQGRLDEALASYQRSLEIADRIGARARSAQALVNVAQVSGARGRPDEALAAAARAAALAREIGSQESLCSALTASGRAHQQLGHIPEARRDLEEAVAVLEAMRDEAGATLEDQQRFLESRVAPYEELAALAADEGDAQAALTASERAKGRVLLDILHGGRAPIGAALTDAEREQERALRTSLRSANAQLRREQGRPAPDRARVSSLETARQQARVAHQAFESRLYAAHPDLKAKRGQPELFTDADTEEVLTGRDSAAVAFLVTSARTYLFVLTRDAAAGQRLQVHPLSLGRQELGARVADFRERIARRDLSVRAEGRKLFDLLLGPAQVRLAGRRELVIVPDGPLWELPFQALVGPRGRHLVEDAALAYAPSLTVLREMRRAAATRPRAPRSLLAVGDPVVGGPASGAGPRLMSGTLAPLPEAEAQVRALGRLYGPARSAVYWGTQASEQRVKQEASRYRIVHFATHGVLDDRRPLYSYVALARSDGGAEDGLLEAWELMEMRLDADLVVLSACETGRGRFAAGEGLIGMTWAAFVAGSPATVASLWKVDAASTGRLMVEFHRALRRGGGTDLPKAEALRHAALTTMRDSRYRHPFYWAGFAMVGDPH